MIIGLAGYAGSGKDTVGNILVEQYGYRRIAFADNVKELTLKVDPVIWDNEEELDVPLSYFVERYGWDVAKKDRQVRELLQKTGQGAREVLGEDVWIDAALKDVGYDENIVITDVRYPNEVEIIHEMCGDVLWIDRPGVGPLNDHDSENSVSMSDCDWITWNTGSLDRLRDNIAAMMEEFEL
jgi:hypothetical protein